MLRERAAWELGDDWQRTGLGLLVPPSRRRRDRPIAVDLFAGAGGFSLGMHQAGVHVAAAVEIDYSAALTYTINLARPGVRFHFDTAKRRESFERAVEAHLGLASGRGRGGRGRGEQPLITSGPVAGSGWIAGQPADHPGCEHFWVADARNIRGQQILDALEVERGEVDIVVGGPPCQGFSVAGKREVMDPRNSLVFEFARLVLELAPKAFVMENVPGMLSMVTPEGVSVVDAFCRVLADGGFGSYDMLRRSVAASAGAGMALRSGGNIRDAGDERPGGQARARRRRTPGSEQPSLLDGIDVADPGAEPGIGIGSDPEVDGEGEAEGNPDPVDLPVQGSLL